MGKTKARRFTELAPRKRAFVEYYINSGGDLIESVFNAGYKADCSRTDPKARRSASALGRAMLKEPLIHEYVTMNMPIQVNLEGIIDEPAIVEVMTLILTGKTQRLMVNRKGEQIVVEPSFRDSCEAAKVLLTLKKMQDKHTPVEQRSVLVSKRLDELIASTQVEYDGAEEED